MEFIEEGIVRIRHSPDLRTAQRSFDRSCEICCYRGLQIRCDHCKIAYVFEQARECFSDLADIKNVNLQIFRKEKNI